MFNKNFGSYVLIFFLLAAFLFVYKPSSAQSILGLVGAFGGGFLVSLVARNLPDNKN
jgi:lipopolysaccharide export LptBFGC system permease protein LptF